MIRAWPPPEEKEAFKRAIESGQWVAPVACGLEASGSHTSIVALCPATTAVTMRFDRPGRYDQELVDAWMEEASQHFMSPLCCAVDALVAPLALYEHIPLGHCYWVRYQGLRAEKPWQARRAVGSAADEPYATHPNHIKALALARQLHADFHDFETVHTDLHFLQESVKRLTCILYRSFVPDLQYVVTRCHDKVRF